MPWQTRMSPLALAGFTGFAACTGTTPPPSSPPRELGDYERSLVGDVTPQDVREAARRIHSPCRSSGTKIELSSCTDDQAGRLSEAASWLARLRQSDAVAKNKSPFVFEVFAAMESLEGVSFRDPFSNDPQSYVKAGVMDSGTADSVGRLRRRLFEQAIERASEEAQGYIDGKKSCDLSRPYDHNADLLEVEKGPCTKTYLQNLLGALDTLLMADGAAPKLVSVEPKEEVKASSGGCARHEWTGGRHEAQLVPAFLGLSEKLDYWMVTCWHVSRMQVSASVSPITVSATQSTLTVEATQSSPTVEATQTSPTVRSAVVPKTSPGTTAPSKKP